MRAGANAVLQARKCHNETTSSEGLPVDRKLPGTPHLPRAVAFAKESLRESHKSGGLNNDPGATSLLSISIIGPFCKQCGRVLTARPLMLGLAWVNSI